MSARDREVSRLRISTSCAASIARFGWRRSHAQELLVELTDDALYDFDEESGFVNHERGPPFILSPDGP